MTKILMVCLGNICRSPLAEGILRNKVNPNNLLVDSAGTGNYHIDEPPCSNSQKIAKDNLLDISNLRARQVRLSDFEEFDYIFAMDTTNYSNLIDLATTSNHKQKVKLLLDEVFPGEKMNVPDPYNSSYFAFKNIFRMLDQACDSIVENYLITPN